MDRIGCEGCGIKIPEPSDFESNPDPALLLCDECLKIKDGEEG